MSGEVCTRGRVPVMFAVLVVVLGAASPALAQSAPATFKVAYYNVQSGKGEPALAGRTAHFSDTANCTDLSQPVNAWGIGFFQQHLAAEIGNDPKIVALGLGESWPSVCASPENIRRVLGWKSRTSSQNGVAMVAKYGFVGPEEWLQLDTSLNTNPADTMWALRMTVCLDANCAKTMNVFTAHWYGAGSQRATSYGRQARATLAFLQRAGGMEPHVFTGDLNVWDGVAACGQKPDGAPLQLLRDAGYVDAWPLLHGAAEGFTGMTNRAGCGVPVGYGWKRPDYTWAPSHFLPVSMTRFGVTPAGEDAPSDHYGIITEFPVPGVVVVPVDDVAPTVTMPSPLDGVVASGSAITITVQAADAVGVERVEILEDGVVTHTLTAAPYQVTCAALSGSTGTHTLVARAVDAAGNVGASDMRRVTVEEPPPARDDDRRWCRSLREGCDRGVRRLAGCP